MKGLEKSSIELFEMTRCSSGKLYCHRAIIFKWHGPFRKGRTSIEGDERYGCLASLRPTFVTKVKDMPDTIRRILCRAMSWYRNISRFTVKTIIFIKENYP